MPASRGYFVIQQAIVSAALVGLLGCNSLAFFTRPEGDGGWPAATRDQQMARRASAAGVQFESARTPRTTTGAAPAAAANPAPLDLATALTLAVAHNLRIAEAAGQVDIARARVSDARGRLLPATVASGRYTLFTAAQTNQITLPPGLLPPGTPASSIEVRESDFGVVNAILTLPLDLSGEIRQALAAAQAGYRGEVARQWATTLEQQLLVTRAYFNLLEAQHLRLVTEQTITLDRQQLTTARSRFDAGRATKNDLLVVEVALQNAEQRLRQRDLAIARARWSLNQTVGRPVDAPTTVRDVSIRPTVPAVTDALQAAYQHNPALNALLEEQQRFDAQVASLRRSRLPRLFAGGAIDYTSATILQPQDVGSGFAGFTWDLGTDTRREAQITEALVAADQNQLRIERDLRELEVAIRTTHEGAQERLAAWATAETAVGQAEENLRIRQQQFVAGRAQSDDVLIAEALLAQQRATLASALYQAHIRRAELQQLIGLPLDTAGL